MTLTLCAALLAAYDRLAVAYLTRAAIESAMKQECRK